MFACRFRSAKETEERDKEVLRKGGKLPEGQKFDSNCITPGTSFMARLQAQLKFFVASKMSADKLWQKVTVILSGHEVSSSNSPIAFDLKNVYGSGDIIL